MGAASELCARRASSPREDSLLIDTLKEKLQAERLTALSLLLGTAMFVVLSLSVMVLPPVAQLAMVAGAVGVVAFFLRPADLLLAFFLGRIVLDLLWWIPGRVGSLNLMELFTGGVSGLAGLLIALDLRRHERHPCLPAIVPYVVVLAFGGLRNLELRQIACGCFHAAAVTTRGELYTWGHPTGEDQSNGNLLGHNSAVFAEQVYPSVPPRRAPRHSAAARRIRPRECFLDARRRGGTQPRSDRTPPPATAAAAGPRGPPAA